MICLLCEDLYTLGGISSLPRTAPENLQNEETLPLVASNHIKTFKSEITSKLDALEQMQYDATVHKLKANTTANDQDVVVNICRNY